MAVQVETVAVSSCVCWVVTKLLSVNARPDINWPATDAPAQVYALCTALHTSHCTAV